MVLGDTLIKELRAIVPGSVVSDPEELPAYGQDFWGARGVPGAVVRARSADDVAATLRFATQHSIPVVPRAAGTNIGAGYLPTPERILLDLRPMNRIRSIDPEGREAIVEPGLLNGDLQAHLAPLGLSFAADPASRAISTVGGNLIENAGGPRCLKYGVTYHHVAGVECVLAGGDRVRFNADDPGPDLLGVVIGSEGTLAIVTEARLRLRPLPQVTRTLLAVYDRVEDAVAAVSATIAAGLIPAALEFFDREAASIFEGFVASGYPTDAEALLLVDIEGTPQDVARDLPEVATQLAQGAREIRQAVGEEERATMWRGRILSGQALRATGLGYLICDTTVPREQIPSLREAVAAIGKRLQLRIMINGHAGDGNMHPVILFDRDDPHAVAAAHAAADELVGTALRLGGTLTGEHGVGSEKLRHMGLRFRPAEIAAQRALKQAFDPQGLLNPGVLLPAPALNEPPQPRLAQRLRETVVARRAGHIWSPVSVSTASDSSPGSVAPIVVDAANLTAAVDARTHLDDLHQTLRAHQLACPLPVSSSAARTVGAVMSSDMARAGSRDCLLGAQVRLPDGDTARWGSSAVKDVAGYDMKRLSIGTGQTFGTLESLILKVTPERYLT